MVQTKTATTSRAPAARPSAIADRPVIGRWQLGPQIGEGRIARVYAARPVSAAGLAEDAYALKMLKWPWDIDPRGLAMLRREAQVGRAVSHPHLITVLDACFDGASAPHLVMPRLDGVSAAALCGVTPPLDVPIALWIGRQIAEALASLHTVGWVHGDVKPENILVDSSGHATLLDLGFARPIGELTSPGDVPLLGTPAYLAPEMLLSNWRADQRSELFSLGATLFELLAGRPLFDAKSPVELIAQHREGFRREVRQQLPRVPVQVARLLKELLATDPMRRPQSASEVVERLAKLEIATFDERLCA